MTCLWKLIVQVSVILRKTVGRSDYTNLDNQLPQTCFLNMVASETGLNMNEILF